MKFKLIIFIIFNFLFTSGLYAQIQYSYPGTIFSSDSTLLLKNIEVINKRTKQTLYSGADGSFHIDANPYDSIMFVHPHWNTLTIEAYDLPELVYLQKKAIVLEEIVIMGNTKAARFKELHAMKHDYNVKGGLHYSGKPPWYLLSPFGGSPITFFYEKFSAAGKNARRFEKFMNQEIENMEVDQIFNKVSIYEIIPMENDELEKFMVEYRPDLETAQYWTTYDLHVYVKNSYKEFKEKNSQNHINLK
ncbi:hypothetical protein [Sphingobacterium sp. 1.A.5]|uniref:hypothetical protein n=1 Tax=Sphingobacterium sp. 1.A.5 TaxID=2044604 RepID=UPI000C0BD680|nr:hypothetical protein [Sphingobacterium sp. 1.A.5]